jgi:hypothetical protein
MMFQETAGIDPIGGDAAAVIRVSRATIKDLTTGHTEVTGKT